MASPLTRLRAMCLALPEAEERETWENETFRVRDKIFAMHIARPEPAVWCKAPPGAQAILLEANPLRFFRPPYLGPKGWIGIHLDDGSDWDEVEDLVRRSYSLIAPRRLAGRITS